MWPSRNVDRQVDAAGRRPAPRRGTFIVLAGLCRAAALVAICLANPALHWGQQAPPVDSETRGVARVVQDVSRGLQAGNAASFLRFFDRRRFEGYPTLESHIVALTTQSDIASSIKVVEIEPIKRENGETSYRLRVDWLLRLSVQETPGPLETRREVIDLIAAREQNERWRIVSLKPMNFFRPQQPGRE